MILYPVKLTISPNITLTMSLVSENTDDLREFYKQISANGELLGSLLTFGGVGQNRAGWLSMEDCGKSHLHKLIPPGLPPNSSKLSLHSGDPEKGPEEWKPAL